MKTLRVLPILFGVCLSLPAQTWVGSWAASQQVPTGANALAANELQSATLRQIVHLSLGGEQLRIRIANTFGTVPLHLAAVHIAKPKSAVDAAIDPGTDRALSFDGKPDVVIPAGAEYLSDPIAFHATTSSDLAITIRYTDAPDVQTSHPGSRATSYLSHTAAVDAATMPDAKKFEHWFQISGVDVPASKDTATVVTLGDSITDGHGATDNGNDRWPDDLAARLLADAKTRSRGVLNHGLGGNRVLLDGQGPNALARFSRDVLAQPGVKYVIVFEGVNDLGMSTKDAEISPEDHAALVAHILGAYEQMIDRAHTAGLKIYGATITPYQGFIFYHPTATNEADRQKINAWIRASGHFDAVLDFDKIVADPADPARLLPKFDSGDHIHPNQSAYHAIAESIPLSLFAK
ncbi:SGNH/GDSL hydrolase family protein [Terriglobus roseus]|uniref:Lysophospholipase L1 n=1 Tax=Terriglobus roseus TaxID=392734 RepID=A0A1G7Q5H9_9BACT|nr:SGNH/GDSL hydrolase family protein [Terriglobus roseus]SDF93199.1 Lysophospholipase L1 [Terriglobus roseus]